MEEQEENVSKLREELTALETDNMRLKQTVGTKERYKSDYKC